MDNAPAPPVRRKLFANRPAWAKEVSLRDESEIVQPDLFGRKPNLESFYKLSPRRDAKKQELDVANNPPAESPRRSPKRRRVSLDGSPDSAQSDTGLYQYDDEAMWGRDRTSLDPEGEWSQFSEGCSSRPKAVEIIEDEATENKPSSQYDLVNVVSLDSSDEEHLELRNERILSNQASVEVDKQPGEKFHQESPYRNPKSTSLPQRKLNEGQKEASRSSSPENWIERRIVPEPLCNPLADGIVRILIHSPIPNTNPLIIQRKLSQRLKECRMAWCAKQGFDEEQTNEVFLTWRGRRLFDLTTCKSLGISVNEDGDAVIKGQSQPMIAENAQLEMEAVTQATLEQNKRAQKEEEIARQNEFLAAASPKKEKHQGIRIILKAKDYEEYKLIVKPTTKFAQILKTFRKVRKVPEDGSAFLMFDGEKLAEDLTMSESDIADMDTIEVYVR